MYHWCKKVPNKFDEQKKLHRILLLKCGVEKLKEYNFQESTTASSPTSSIFWLKKISFNDASKERPI